MCSYRRSCPSASSAPMRENPDHRHRDAPRDEETAAGARGGTCTFEYHLHCGNRTVKISRERSRPSDHRTGRRWQSGVRIRLSPTSHPAVARAPFGCAWAGRPGGGAAAVPRDPADWVRSALSTPRSDGVVLATSAAATALRTRPSSTPCAGADRGIVLLNVQCVGGGGTGDGMPPAPPQ